MREWTRLRVSNTWATKLVLGHGENVAVRIFEPGGLEFSGDVDVAFA